MHLDKFQLAHNKYLCKVGEKLVEAAKFGNHKKRQREGEKKVH